jgi:uncharacterized protein
MPAEVILAGFPSLVLWLSLDVPDTDIEVNLYEALPEGAAIWSDVLRARYRESERSVKLITLGEIDRYYFDPRFFVARRLAKESRLRLIVSAPNSIYYEKNYNSGGIVADETKAGAHAALVVLYHDAEHASSLTVPIGSTEK